MYFNFIDNIKPVLILFLIIFSIINNKSSRIFVTYNIQINANIYQILIIYFLINLIRYNF